MLSASVSGNRARWLNAEQKLKVNTNYIILLDDLLFLQLRKSFISCWLFLSFDRTSTLRNDLVLNSVLKWAPFFSLTSFRPAPPFNSGDEIIHQCPIEMDCTPKKSWRCRGIQGTAFVCGQFSLAFSDNPPIELLVRVDQWWPWFHFRSAPDSSLPEEKTREPDFTHL